VSKKWQLCAVELAGFVFALGLLYVINLTGLLQPDGFVHVVFFLMGILYQTLISISKGYEP
jgi:hypothetical protein